MANQAAPSIPVWIQSVGLSRDSKRAVRHKEKALASIMAGAHRASQVLLSASAPREKPSNTYTLLVQVALLE